MPHFQHVVENVELHEGLHANVMVHPRYIEEPGRQPNRAGEALRQQKGAIYGWTCAVQVAGAVAGAKNDTAGSVGGARTAKPMQQCAQSV